MAWGVVIGAIAISVAAILLAPTPEPTSKVMGIVATPIAITILGAGTIVVAISIAVVAGGIGALNKLRKFKVVSNSANKLILKRR